MCSIFFRLNKKYNVYFGYRHLLIDFCVSKVYYFCLAVSHVHIHRYLCSAGYLKVPNVHRVICLFFCSALNLLILWPVNPFRPLTSELIVSAFSTDDLPSWAIVRILLFGWPNLLSHCENTAVVGLQSYGVYPTLQKRITNSKAEVYNQDIRQF